MDKKFLGVCIVLASLILSGTLLYTSISIGPKDRYKVAGAKVFDVQEGKYVEESKGNVQATTFTQNQSEIVQTNVLEILDNSLIQCEIQIPEPSSTTPASGYSSARRNAIHERILKITVKNMSPEYIVKYIELDIKLYKDEVMFMKDIVNIGDKDNISISPLSSYEIDYSLDLNTAINYPDKPWKSEAIIKNVKGVTLEQ